MTEQHTTPDPTVIEADPTVPTIRIVREFDAVPALVFRAWTEPDLVAKWLGPKDITTDIDEWELRTGGHYRYRNSRAGEQIASFYGSFHEVRPNARLVQTFTYEGVPDAVSLETVTFSELPGGRTGVEIVGVVESFEIRGGILASGMEVGVADGFIKLDQILSELAARV